MCAVGALSSGMVQAARQSQRRVGTQMVDVMEADMAAAREDQRLEHTCMHSFSLLLVADLLH